MIIFKETIHKNVMREKERKQIIMQLYLITLHRENLLIHKHRILINQINIYQSINLH